MNEYQPRPGDGSIAAEDDSLLRQPTDDDVDDVDVVQDAGDDQHKPLENPANAGDE